MCTYLIPHIFETHVIALNNRNRIDYISPTALPLRDTFNAEFSYSKLLSSRVRVVPILVLEQNRIIQHYDNFLENSLISQRVPICLAARIEIEVSLIHL